MGDLLRLKASHQHRENGADRAGGGLELVAEIPRNGGEANNVCLKYQISTGVVKITSLSVKSVRMPSTTACI